jgi:hypothetical protein
MFYQLIVALAPRLQADGSARRGGGHIPHGYEEIILWHQLLPLFCPFNHTNSIAVEVVLQPEASNFAKGIETIEINVV